MRLKKMEKKLELSAGTKVMHSSRLTLRKFNIDDAMDVHKNWAADEEVAKYTLWKPVSNFNDTFEYVHFWEMNYKKQKCFHWAIVLNETDSVIGSISISEINTYARSCNVGYTLGKEFWNRGIATEALKMVLDYLANFVGFKKIYGFYDVRNAASGRVMEKANMKFIKRKSKYFFGFKAFKIDCNIYCYENDGKN